MALNDLHGEPVSTSNRRSLDRFEHAADLLSGLFADPLAVIDEALEEDPGFVMGHCMRAGLMLMAAEKSAQPELRRSVEAAEALASTANDRERGHTAAARAWLDGDFHRAGDLYAQVLLDHPRDLLALQIGHQIDFFTGNAAMLRDRPARVLPQWDAAVPGYGYVLGMQAFGLEENNMFRRAEDMGRHAVELTPRDPWAIHAVAHVMEMEGRLADGIRWMTSRVDDWAPDNMLAIHNWWHLALYHLDYGQTGSTLDIYDRHIRPRPGGMAIELVDATSMLWRLHLRGVDVGDRWTAAADAWEPMADDGYYAFNDMHAMMAFIGAGRDQATGRLMAVLNRRASGTGSNAAMTREVGLPVCAAMRAFADGHYDLAIDLLLPVRAVSHRFGGSNAQRDVITLTLIEAALRGGRPKLARALTAERTDFKPSSPFNWTLAARALDGAGDGVAAERARLRSARLSA
jgi:hypothetical protein